MAQHGGAYLRTDSSGDLQGFIPDPVASACTTMHYLIAHRRISLYGTFSYRTEEAGACSGLELRRQGVSDAPALGPTKLAQESGMNGKQVLEKSWSYEACVTCA